MPNWCSNMVEVSATEKEIKRLKKAIDQGNKAKAEKGLLNALVPQPKFENDSDWYDWNVSNWGTKWEVSMVSVNDEDKTSLALTFDTAWGPAVQAFQTWAEADPDRDFTYKYFEPGMGFVGTAGPGYDDCITHDQDSDEYRRIAEEEWGEDFSWQDEEEDEDTEDDELLAEDDDSETDDVDSYELPSASADMQTALQELKREFEALMAAEEDPEYRYLKQDIETLSQRVADYKQRKEGNDNE